MYKRILLAYDGSQSGQKALLDCREIAEWGHSELFLVAVMPSPATFIGAEGGVYDAGSEERVRQQYQGILDEGIRRLAEEGHKANGEVLTGDAVEEIAKCAARVRADLIVVGNRHSRAGPPAGGAARFPRRSSSRRPATCWWSSRADPFRGRRRFMA